MNHKVRGFYPFKGLFLYVDIRICERLLSQMPEAKIMQYRGRIHELISDIYGELAAIKIEIEEYELALNSMGENEKKDIQASTGDGKENSSPSVKK